MTEVLKGLTIISITGLSLKYPLFFLLLFLTVIIQYLFDKTGPYKDPYEKSLLVSMLFMFLFFDYKKLNTNKFYETIHIFSKPLNVLVLTIFAIIAYSIFECYMMKQEVSHKKLYTRIILLIQCIITINIFSGSVDGIKILCYYLMGYFLISIMVQYKSLQKLHNPNHPEKLESL